MRLTGLLPRLFTGPLAFLPPLLAAGATLAAEEPKPAGMPQLDPTHFSAQVFWLVVTFVVFYLVVARVVLPRIGSVLEDRQSRIDRDLAKAGEFKGEAEKVAAEYEAALAEGRANAQAVLRKTAEAAAAVAAERHAALAERLARDIKTGEERIAKARAEAVGNIRGVAAEVAQAAVERLVGVKVDPARAAAAVDSVAKEQR
ncbi:MAG: F0F1 ATP synthase subunit B' [Candidatus Eiseniibacteriota bacterium]